MNKSKRCLFKTLMFLLLLGKAVASANGDMKDTKRMQEERSIFNDILKSFFDKEFIPPTLKPNLRNETDSCTVNGKPGDGESRGTCGEHFLCFPDGSCRESACPDNCAWCGGGPCTEWCSKWPLNKYCRTDPEHPTHCTDCTMCKYPCETNEGPEPNKTCIIPFIWNDVKYEACAPKDGTDDYFCATEVDFSNGVAKPDDAKWGICDRKKCLITETTSPAFNTTSTNSTTTPSYTSENVSTTRDTTTRDNFTMKPSTTEMTTSFSSLSATNRFTTTEDARICPHDYPCGYNSGNTCCKSDEQSCKDEASVPCPNEPCEDSANCEHNKKAVDTKESMSRGTENIGGQLMTMVAVASTFLYLSWSTLL